MNDVQWFVKKFGPGAIYINVTADAKFKVRAGGYYGEEFESIADSVGEAMRELRPKFERHWYEEAKKDLERAQRTFEYAQQALVLK